MKKEKYITEVKSKNGITYIVKIPYDSPVNLGEREFYTKSFPTKKYGSDARAMAIAHRNEMLVEIQQHGYTHISPTVKELYKKTFDLFPCRMNTRKNHDYFYNNAIKDYEDIQIKDLKVADIQECINKYASNHTKDMTSKLLAVWRQIYHAAAMMEISVSDKTLSVVIPSHTKISDPKPVMISDKDFLTFMDALLHYHEYEESGRYMSQVLWYGLMIAYYTGMRPAEIYALRRDDIHLNEEYIDVYKSVGSNTGQYKVIVPTKTKNSIRKIPISPDLKKILIDLLSWTDHEYLISMQNGELMDTNYSSNYIHLVSQKCKIPFNFYMLRHKFATDLQKTEAPRTVQDLMGHASFSMSMEYARSSEEDREEAVKKRKLQ